MRNPSYESARRMRMGGRALLMGATSLLSVVAAGTASAQAISPVPQTEGQAPDSPAADAGSDAGTIVVTGTRIRGIAPVGSTVLALGKEELAKNVNSSTADFLRKVPQVLSFGGTEGRAGGAGFQGDSGNVSYANSINLRGVGTAATLNLLNGHRVPPGGPSSDLFEPDYIPSIALETIQIVPDGASAIYGSDAVTGVVNYIMREPFKGLEAAGHVGIADNRTEWKASVIGGFEWGSGGIVLSYEHIFRDSLKASDRPNLFNEDYSRFGGPGFANDSAPGNIVTPGGLRGIPAGSNGRVTLASLLPTANSQSRWVGVDALPKIRSNSVAGKFKQEITPGVRLYADGFFYRRDFVINQSPYVTTAPLSVPASNPYSPCNPANLSATNPLGIDCSSNLLVRYNFLNDIGPYVRSGSEQNWNAAAGVQANLPFKTWTADFYVSRGQASNASRSDNNQVVTSRLTALLAGPVNGIPAFNPFCDGTPNCNDPRTSEYLKAWNQTNFTLDRVLVSLSANGSLFALPGGDVRLAVGGEYYKDDFHAFNENANNGTYVRQPPSDNRRTVKAAFGEIFVPLFGDGNAVPGLQRLELSAALRVEKYSDFGTTSNPKFGFNWVPVDGLKFHGSYGTSFRAPVLSSNIASSQAGTLTTIPSLGSDLAGAGFTGGPGSYVPTYVIGGNAGLAPEKATTWSFGADYSPSFAPGLKLTINYYRIKYTGKIDYAAYNAGPTSAILSPYLSSYVIRNPAFFNTGLTLTQDQFNTLLDALVNNKPQPSYSPYDTVDPRLIIGATPTPQTTIALIDGRRNNVGVVETDGLDLTADYRFPVGNGTLTLGAIGTYVFNYNEAVAAGAPIDKKVNKFGGPLRFKGRGEISYDTDRWSGSLFMNFDSAYGIDRRYIPAGVSDRYLHVNAYATFDMSFTYRFPGGGGLGAAGSGLDITLGVQNVLNTEPPLVLNSSSSVNFPGIQFDSSRASALGRLVSISARKRF